MKKEIDYDIFVRKYITNGNYIEEGNFPNIFLVSNYPLEPDYILNDFMVLFGDYFKFFYNPKYKFIKNYSQENYDSKKLYMNCWKFILLYLHEVYHISKENIELLYNKIHFEKKRILDVFYKGVLLLTESNLPKKGDILIMKNRQNILYHCGIFHDIKYHKNILLCFEIFNSPISIHEYNLDNLYGDTIYFISPHNARNLIIEYIENYNIYNFCKNLTDILPYSCLLNWIRKVLLQEEIKKIPKPKSREELDEYYKKINIVINSYLVKLNLQELLDFCKININLII